MCKLCWMLSTYYYYYYHFYYYGVSYLFNSVLLPFFFQCTKSCIYSDVFSYFVVGILLIFDGKPKFAVFCYSLGRSFSICIPFFSYATVIAIIVISFALFSRVFTLHPTNTTTFPAQRKAFLLHYILDAKSKRFSL